MSAVLRCPVCVRDLDSKQWSPAQWKNWNPWQAGRNCCVECQDAQSGEHNTWCTQKEERISRLDYTEYVAQLREGWQNSQQSFQSRKTSLLCPVCRRQVERGKWSRAQWRNLNPWDSQRNCCTDCEDNSRTWTTVSHERIIQSNYFALRAGWLQTRSRNATQTASSHAESSAARSRSPRRTAVPASQEPHHAASTSITTLAISLPELRRQEIHQIPLHVCWNVLGHIRPAWALDVCWDRFGFHVQEDVLVVMYAFQAGETTLARVDYPHGLHRGPHAVVILELDGEQEEHLLHTLCTKRAVLHWVSRWRRGVRRLRSAREMRAIVPVCPSTGASITLH